jgi:hypothetical protein
VAELLEFSEGGEVGFDGRVRGLEGEGAHWTNVSNVHGLGKDGMADVPC